MMETTKSDREAKIMEQTGALTKQKRAVRKRFDKYDKMLEKHVEDKVLAAQKINHLLLTHPDLPADVELELKEIIANLTRTPIEMWL